jgi:hypothetical protein
MIFQLVKGTCLHQNIQKIYQMDGETPPLYQTLLVKGSFDDSYSTSQYDGYSS